MANVMKPEDYKIYALGFDGGRAKAAVVCDLLCFGQEWPPTIFDPKTGKMFKFDRNVVMEKWMIGNYGGHALYYETFI